MNRKEQRRPCRYLVADAEEQQLPHHDAYARMAFGSAESAALAHISSPDLKAALNMVPPVRRTAVYLADVEGFSYREIADFMGTPPGHGHVPHPPGRKQVRSLLLPQNGHGGS
jgi:RNA polymerase sigma-70 factor (ECF subfamily)